MRNYLIYKMSENGVSRGEICEKLHISEKTLRNKLSGRTDFTWEEVRKIRNTFFPKEEYEILFQIS